jgi:hypothetical protein
VDVLELSTTRVVLETPSQPAAYAGHVVDFDVSGRRGMLLVESIEQQRYAQTARYHGRLIHQDEGLLAALERAADGRESVVVTHRMWGRAPTAVSDDDVIAGFARALLCSDVPHVSEVTAIALVRHLVACDRTAAREHLERLVARGRLRTIDTAPDSRRYMLR